MRRIILIGMGATLIFASSVFAGEEADAVDNIVVTGTRTTDILAEIPSTTSVINLEEIEARNDTSVADLLRNMAGIHVTQPSGQGGVARIFVRGADLEMTMVLLDGIRVNDLNDSRGSAFDFSTVNLNDVERIEIVRGPQSAIYGSDALAGVISIISKGPAEKLGGSVYAEAGMDDYYRGALDVAGPIGNAGGFSLRVATKDDGEPVTDTTFSSDSVSGRLSFANGESFEMKFFGGYTDSEGTAFPEDSGGADLAVLRTVDTRSSEDLRFGFNGSFGLADNWWLNVLATRYDHDSSFLSPGVAPGVRDGVPPNGADSNLKRNDIAVNAVVDFSDSFTATFGVDYYDEEGISEGFVEFAPGFVVPAGFQLDRSGDRFPDFEKIIHEDNRQLVDELMPCYRDMVNLFRDKMGLAEPSTLEHFGALVEFVEIWDRWLDETIPAEVPGALEHGEEKLYPLYDDLSRQFRRLQKELVR